MINMNWIAPFAVERASKYLNTNALALSRMA